MRTGLVLLLCAGLAACGSERPKSERALRFWHTFNSSESGALESLLSKPGRTPVETTILPFARATHRFRSAIEEGECPDLLRIDGTRIPELVEAKTIHEVPPAVWSSQVWLPEAEALVSFGGKQYGLPQSLDGLALVSRRGEDTQAPPQRFDHWIARARRAETQPSLGILLDGYWFVTFLRSAGGDLPNAQGEPSAVSESAQRALESFAELFSSGVAMNLAGERAPARAMTKAFRKGQLQQVLTGPWHLVDLAGGDVESLEVSAVPGGYAPRGGQTLVVPQCARDPKGAWSLAKQLTAPSLQATWAQQLSSIPVTRKGLDNAGRVVNEFYEALQDSRALPRHSRVPQLFDDLTPAVVAVASGDASAAEALAGVSRAWDRIYGIKRQPLEP